MAKIEYIDIVSGLEDWYWSALQYGDRFTHARVRKKVYSYSRKSRAGFSQRSLLPQIAVLWNAFSDAERTAWAAAAAQMGTFVATYKLLLETGDELLLENGYKIHLGTGVLRYLNGWRLFVSDQCARIVNEIAGVATPSLFHQSWVGNLKIEAPATELKIVQLHPRSYWISRKVTGKKSMYEPVLVTEDLGLPLKISLNYSSDLAETSEGSFAKFYARVWYSYQGVNLYHDLEIPLNYITDWRHAEVTLTTLLSYVVRVDLYFHLYNLQGNLYFDNIELTHSGQNWARDPFCKDILQGFTKAFYQIPDHWAAVTLPAGAIYDSIYKDFDEPMNSLTLTVKNNSGVALTEGDVVIWDTTQDLAVKTTTDEGDINVAGVVSTGGINGANIIIFTAGYVGKVLTTFAVGTGRGTFLATSSIAKKAFDNYGETNGAFAKALTHADASGYVSACFIVADVY